MPDTLLIVAAVLAAFVWWQYTRRRRKVLESRVAEQTTSLIEANKSLEQAAGDLRRTQAELLESAHRAGMAEVASDVLHNIGNALTSLQVSATIIETGIGNMRIDFLKNLGQLLEEQKHRLPEFFMEKKGLMTIDAITKIAAKMEENRDELIEEMHVLNEQVFSINEIVISQRDYTFGGVFLEPVDVRAMMDDVLRFQEASLEEFHIKVKRDYEVLPSLRGAKSVLLHIFNNLIKNAVEALSGCDWENREIEVIFKTDASECVVLEVRDNGVGIAEENLTAIFSQHWISRGGYKRGNLHYCANAISGMGGALSVRSDGLGKGATFVLEIPRAPKGRGQNLVNERTGYK